MKNIHNQNTIGVLTIAVILMFALLGMYAYAFYIVKAKNEEASLVSSELDDYLSKEGTINLLKRSVKDTEEARANITGHFVHRDDLPEFTRSIEELGNMSDTSVIITGLHAEGNILIVDLTSSGNFVDTFHLVSLLEKLPFVAETTKAYINVSQKNSDSTAPEEFASTETLWNGSFTIEISGFIDK